MSTLRDATLRMAALQLLLNAVDAEHEQARTYVLAQLKAAHADLGLKSAQVKLPNDTVIGSVTLTQPKDRIVVADERAYIAWVTDQHPEEIEIRVRPVFAKKHLASLDYEDGEVFDPATGEVIPGLAVVKAGEPDRFSYRHCDAAALAAAMRDGLARDLLVEITGGGPSAITEGGTDGLGS